MLSKREKFSQLRDFFKQINEKRIYNKELKGGFLVFSNTAEEGDIREPYNTFKKTLDNWIKMIFFRQQYNDEQRAKYEFDSENRSTRLTDGAEDTKLMETQNTYTEDDEPENASIIKLKNKYMR